MKLQLPALSATFATFALMFGLPAAALAQAPRQDGRWEVKMEMEMATMPGRMPPMTSIQCITPEEAKDPQMSMPQAGGGGVPGNCTVSDRKVPGVLLPHLTRFLVEQCQQFRKNDSRNCAIDAMCMVEFLFQFLALNLLVRTDGRSGAPRSVHEEQRRYSAKEQLAEA